MKRYQTLSRVFLLLAVLLSDVMCIVVTFNYCTLKCGGLHMGWSAPASVAFVLIPPYAAGIAACLFLALFFRKKFRQTARKNDFPQP